MAKQSDDTYEEIDITPDPYYLQAVRRQNIPWATMLGELTDNSLDSGANRVHIVIGPGRKLVIRDDGTGSPTIGNMIRLGGRFQHRTTRLGKYGVGLKDVVLSLWGITEIETNYRGEKRQLTIDWEKVDRWIISASPASKTSDVGTIITCRNISRQPKISHQELASELGYIFTPALRAGKQILLESGRSKPVLCTGYTLPTLSDVVEDEFVVYGKSVRLRAGIVPQDYRNLHPGFTYLYGHRVIMTSGLGAGGKSTRDIAATVELSRDWVLTKNKNDIAEHADELGEEIFHRCRTMLSKAEQKSRIVSSEALNSRVGSLLTAALGSLSSAKRREKRDRGETEGTITPKLTGTTRRKAKQSTSLPGSVDAAIESALQNGVKIDWCVFENREQLGSVDLTSDTVWLNLEHLSLVHARTSTNDLALAWMAMGLFVEQLSHVDADKAQRYLKGMSSFDFISVLGKVLLGMPTGHVELKAAQ